MKKYINVSYLTYIYFVLMLLSGYIKYSIYVLLIFFIHELGHILAFYICHIKIKKINIYPFGGVIESEILLNTSSIKIFFISISGILMQNIFLILIKDPLFITINKYIMYLNLLPIFPLDGNKIILSLFESIRPYYYSVRYAICISFITLFFLNNNYFLFVILYVFNIKNVLLFKYQINKFYLERYIYNIKHKRVKVIKCMKKMFKNYNNYLIRGNIILDESEYLYESIDKT